MNYIIYSDSCNYHDLHSQITQVTQDVAIGGNFNGVYGLLSAAY